MHPILVCGFPLGSSLGLVAAFEWASQPYRLARIDMINEMKTPSYARLNPRQETPVLVKPDGTALTETMAIAAWLEQSDVGRKISFAPGSAETDHMHQLAAFVNSSFTGAFGPLWAALEMKSDPPAQETLRNFGRAGVAKRHAQFEAMVGESPYLVGDRPTIADALFVGVARWADFHQVIEPGRYPRLRRLKEILESDPAVRFALAVEEGTKPQGSGACQGYVPLAELAA